MTEVSISPGVFPHGESTPRIRDLSRGITLRADGIMNHGLWIMDYGLWIMDYGLWIMDNGLWTKDYGLWMMNYGYSMCTMKHARCRRELVKAKISDRRLGSSRSNGAAAQTTRCFRRTLTSTEGKPCLPKRARFSALQSLACHEKPNTRHPCPLSRPKAASSRTLPAPTGPGARLADRKWKRGRSLSDLAARPSLVTSKYAHRSQVSDFDHSSVIR